MQAYDLKIPDAYNQFLAQYNAAGKPFHVVEREYYSTGAIIFDVVPTSQSADPPFPKGSIIVPGQYPRFVLRASAGDNNNGGQLAQLFAYKVGDPMNIANVSTAGGTSTRIADVSDTNILVAYQTNDEDFAIRGLGFQIKGLRIEMDPSDDNEASFDEIGLPDSFKKVITTGSGYLEDPGSHVMPPEVDSPLTLHDTLGRAIAKRLRVRELWNNREGDDVALARRFGPAGGESYLKTLGEPTPWNVLRLDPGLKWNRQNTNVDTKFSLQCSLAEDIWTIVSWPQSLVEADDEMARLTRVHVDYQIIATGNAFYYPSANA